MEEAREDFEKQGFGVAGITYDSREVLEFFSDRTGIHYPLLTDPESSIIREFGVLNPIFPPGNVGYGMPFPGYFVVDADGTVLSKYFEKKHRQRYSARSILTNFLGETGSLQAEINSEHLSLRTYMSDIVATPGSRVTLVSEIDLEPGVHIYAPEVTGGYRPTAFVIEEHPLVEIHEPTFPESRTLHLEVIDEEVPVYEGKIRILRDITVSSSVLAPRIELSGYFEFQACDDEECYPPERIPVTFDIQVTPKDRVRPPEALWKHGERQIGAPRYKRETFTPPPL